MFTHATTTAQRRHLDIANREVPRLDRLTEHAGTRPLSGYDWQRAADIAAGIADQLNQVAALAESRDAAQHWADAARYWYQRCDLYELWSVLADAAPAIIEQYRQDQA